MAHSFEILHGRQRRYFGYNRDVTHRVDTPESAKSYRSIMSPTSRTAKRAYEPVKSFKPDAVGHLRFADKMVHRAVKAQIPGLLPALKNSPQFDEFHDNPIYLRSPDFAKNFERSLYNIWLQRPDRNELCQVFNSHLKAKEKIRVLGAKRLAKNAGTGEKMTEEMLNEMQEYLESLVHDSKIRARTKRKSAEVPLRLLRMNRKFQLSYWNPTLNKHLTDPYQRRKNKNPALDSICHEHFGVPDVEMKTCVDEYKRRHAQNLDMSGGDVELGEAREHMRRITLMGSLQEEEARRGHKHIKQLKEYDKESNEIWEKQAKLMIAAAEYINKIKRGRRFPTPPKYIRRSRKMYRDSDRKSDSDSSIDIKDYLPKKQGIENKPTLSPRHRSPVSPRTPTTDGGSSANDRSSVEHRHHHHHKRFHFHHDYQSDDFFMEMYLHFINPDEDVSLKTPPKTLTDVHELRKKMNLDEDHIKELNLVSLLNSDSVEALHIHGAVHRANDPHYRPMSLLEVSHEQDLLQHHLERLDNPRLTYLLTKMVSQMSLTSSGITLSDSGSVTRQERERTSVDVDETAAEPSAERERKDSTQTAPPPSIRSQKERKSLQDDDLDTIGDIPDNELQIIMNEIALQDNPSGSTSSDSGSSGEEEDDGEGQSEMMDDEIKLFKKAKKKKDSLAEFMDLTAEFRTMVCQGVEQTPVATKLNPFTEAVCVLYPDGPDRKKKLKQKVNLVAASLKKI